MTWCPGVKGVVGGGGKPAALIAPHCEPLVATSKKGQADYEALGRAVRSGSQGKMIRSLDKN